MRNEPLQYSPLMTPPFYGTGEILNWKVKDLINSINKHFLFSGYCRAGKKDRKESEKTAETDFEKVFQILKQEILDNNLLDARGYYGFFPVITDDEQLFLLDPSDFHTEIASFRFPRIEQKKWRCFSDYFRAEGDIFSVQVATIGTALDNRCRKYFQEEELYSMGFYLNGIGTYLIDQLAERISTEIKRSLLLPKKHGKRYSFGYSGMPGLEEQKKLLDLMCAEDRLGITLTETFQIEPKHSALGIYVHHPKAEHF